MNLRKLASQGRSLAGTGKSVLRKIGEGARTVRRVAGQVDKATGGAAGLAFEASKSMPGIGTVTSNVERGLNMAEKYSGRGIKAIEQGERLANVGLKASKGDIGAISQLAGGKTNIAGMAGQAIGNLTGSKKVGGMAGQALRSLFP